MSGLLDDAEPFPSKGTCHVRYIGSTRCLTEVHARRAQPRSDAGHDNLQKRLHRPHPTQYDDHEQRKTASLVSYGLAYTVTTELDHFVPLEPAGGRQHLGEERLAGAEWHAEATNTTNGKDGVEKSSRQPFALTSDRH
jgi:hypothetical protein